MKHELIYGKIYERTSGSNLLKYLYDQGDDIGWWNHVSRGAERGTVEDMLTIGDEEIEHSDGLAEVVEE